MIHPQIAVAAIIFHADKVLLIKRANEPNKDQWTFPGGKLVAGETLQQTAERETMEETGIQISVTNIVHTFEMIEYNNDNCLQFHYIIIDMQASYINGQPDAHDDAADARWVSRSELTSLDINQETLKLLIKKYHFV